MAEWQGRSGVALCHPSLTSAGKAILTKAIRRAGWSTDQFTICQPHDIPAGTRAIVALGDQAQEALTGWFGGKRSVKYTRGYLLQGFFGLPVVPTFDPTQLAQGQMKLLGLLMNDIGVALQAAVGARKVCLDPKTVTNYRVGLDALRELYDEALADSNLLVAFDLETATSWGEDEDESIEFSRDTDDNEEGELIADSFSDSTNQEDNTKSSLSRDALNIERAGIRTVQFSLRPSTGVSCDWSDECRDWVQRIMQLPNPFAGHNCFHRHTSVWMSDGSWKPIWQVKIGELVRSVTVEGKLCDRKVTDLVKVYDNRPWVEVKTDGAHNKGLGKHGSPGTVCTPDHQWYVPGRGWKRADQLEIGNTIYLPREGGWDLILGCALGDGHCTRETNALRIAQANKEYSLAKASALGRRLVEKVNKGSFGDTGTLYETCTIIPKCLRDKLYNNDGTRNWIEPTMRALAIWYCDDGNLSGKFPRLSIDRYRKQGIQIQNWFTETFGPTSLYKEGTLIAPRAEAAENFFEAVANFIPPSMQYKLPEKYQNRYDGWIEVQEPQLGKVIEVKERPEILSQKFGRTKYCLTVEGTHSFFTRSGLVRNCWLFDEPILRNHGMEIPEGTHDTLWLSHHLQPDLPKHLQGVASWINFPFPWKHMSGADLDFYGSVDVDSVQWIMRDLPPKLKRLGLWEGYERYVRQFRPVLAAMEKRGIPVSKSKLEELRTWLGQEITRMDNELQPMIPTELKGRKVWKSWPADTKPFVEEYKQSEIAQIKSCLEAEGKKVTKKALSLVVKPGDLPELHRSIISEELGYQWDGDQIYKTLDFNPRSSDQILQFIRAKGYPVPKRFKDQKDTTSDKELERLEVKTKDPVISLVRKIRAYSKMGNAYAGKLLDEGTVEGGWQPGPDGRLRATITFGPATGQLCLPAGTKIEVLRDLSLHPEGINIEDVKVGDWAYTYDDNLNLTLRQVTWSGQTGVKSLVRVHWKRANGSRTGYVDMTPDHLVRLVSGEYKAAKDLSIGERTLALTRTVPKEGYATIMSTGNKKFREHKFVAALLLGATPDKTVHHKDHNKLNNLPSNLDVTTSDEHMREHSLLRGGGSKRRRICPLLSKESGYNSFHYYSEWTKPKIYAALHLEKGSLIKMCKKHHLDYTCFGAYLTLLGIDWKAVRVTYYTSRKYRGNHIITGVEELPGRVPVYDLEIDETHNFIANEVCVHNSARNPNVMTTPKRRAELANKFRQCIVAEPGHKLVELDFTAYHARTLGLAAQDAAYMKLAAMDIHSFVAGHMIKYPGIETALTLSDGDLKQLLEEIKSKHKNVRNFKAKPAILGIGFKMGKRRLYYENRDSYENEAEAGKLISLLHELFPNVFKWQDAICEKADKDGRLINSWGACRWFWDVMKWTRRDGQWVKSTGRDAEKATAYLPSSNAHFMLRDKLLQANSQGWLDRYGLINVIHDAVLFHCPTNLVDECVHNIKTLMEAPVQQMADPKVAPAGFTCGAEAMVGSDWSNMEEIH